MTRGCKRVSLRERDHQQNRYAKQSAHLHVPAQLNGTEEGKQRARMKKGAGSGKATPDSRKESVAGGTSCSPPIFWVHLILKFLRSKISDSLCTKLHYFGTEGVLIFHIILLQNWSLSITRMLWNWSIFHYWIALNSIKLSLLSRKKYLVAHTPNHCAHNLKHK